MVVVFFLDRLHEHFVSGNCVVIALHIVIVIVKLYASR